MDSPDVNDPGGETRIGRYAVITILLFGLVIFRSIFPHWLMTRIFLVLIMVSAWMVSGDRPRTRFVLTFFSVFAVVGSFLDLAVPGDILYTDFYRSVMVSLTVLLLLYCGTLLLLSLVRNHNVTADDILGSVSLYLVIGFIWAYFYVFLESASPGSFAGIKLTQPDGVNETAWLASDFTYFSFITLATQGYGDITPKTDTAETLVILETIVGQLYVALVVAFLLSVFITQRIAGPVADGEGAKREEGGTVSGDGSSGTGE